MKKQLPVKISNLISKRIKLRKNKKWKEADLIREQLKKLGYTLEDDPKGTIINFYENNQKRI